MEGAKISLSASLHPHMIFSIPKKKLDGNKFCLPNLKFVHIFLFNIKLINFIHILLSFSKMLVSLNTLFGSFLSFLFHLYLMSIGAT